MHDLLDIATGGLVTEYVHYAATFGVKVRRRDKLKLIAEYLWFRWTHRGTRKHIKEAAAACAKAIDDDVLAEVYRRAETNFKEEA